MGIYIIQAGEDGPIKIGFTDRDPHGRLHAIQSHNHNKLVLLAVFEGDRKREKLLHQRFAELHLHGEWFRPDDKLLQFIAGMPQPPAPVTRQKWSTLSAAKLRRAQKIWFDQSIPTDVEAGRLIGRHMITIKNNLGKSGRSGRVAANVASERGRKGGEASSQMKHRMPFDRVQKIVDDNPTLTYPQICELINAVRAYKKPWHVSTLMYWRGKRLKLGQRKAGRQPRAPR